jgi:hypothetical protein
VTANVLHVFEIEVEIILSQNPLRQEIVTSGPGYHEVVRWKHKRPNYYILCRPDLKIIYFRDLKLIQEANLLLPDIVLQIMRWNIHMKVFIKAITSFFVHESPNLSLRLSLYDIALSDNTP